MLASHGTVVASTIGVNRDRIGCVSVRGWLLKVDSLDGVWN